MTSKKLVSVDFEVYGRVQGVFFRKYTQQEAKKLNLKGWCMNTERGTVQGVMQGEVNNIETMKKWLKSTGSPSSRIEKAEFSNETDIKSLTFGTFDIKR
ncbi:Acylphosphatase [Popillia japonica]|uniref:Acylphosphatase n=1 Tax=Popillia japonica TaxID=7064 RepID=A0AAW1LPN8_POPJA